MKSLSADGIVKGISFVLLKTSSVCQIHQLHIMKYCCTSFPEPLSSKTGRIYWSFLAIWVCLFSIQLMRVHVLFFIKSTRGPFLWTREASHIFIRWYSAKSLLHILSIKFRTFRVTLDYRSRPILWMWLILHLTCAGHIWFQCLWSKF